MTRPLVGIDLAPARLIQSAPGTARLVTELAPQLARLSVDWDWVPLVDDPDHPLRDVFPGTPARVVPGNGVARRAWWSVGPAWARAGCRLGFATTSFVPWWGPPCVANLFDSNLYEHGDTWRQSGRRLAYVINRLAADHAIHRARRLFVLSAYCTRYLQQRFPGQAGKFVTIPGGLVPLPPPCPVPPAWAAALTKPFFLYVGTFSENKNQRRLLAAWHTLQARHAALPALVLAGPCPPDYLARVITPARQQLPRPQEVLLPGRIPNEELAWAYTHALAGLQPSIAEGFGLPVIEAMSLGLPVACSNTTSLPEVAGGAALLFDPFDPADLARAVEQLWRDEPQRKVLAAAGRERSRVYTWENTARLVGQQIQQVLAELAGRPGGTPLKLTATGATPPPPG